MAFITILAVVSTYLCKTFNLTAEFPLTLIGIAIVFPLVFSINGAYKRREEVLDSYGRIKAHGMALYYASRDWIGDKNKKEVEELADLLEKLLKNIKTLFNTKKGKKPADEAPIYEIFSELSEYIQTMRKRGLSNGEISRSNQYLSKMMIAFEDMKHIYQYRTPKTLRAYNRVFIYLLPIIYGPHFAFVSLEYAPHLWFWIPIVLSVILVGLDNVQDDLENPYDQIGEDDVMIGAEKFVKRLKC